MTQEQKNELVKIIESYIDSTKEDLKVAPKHVGYLNKPIGINGFKVANKDTHVFDSGDRYFIVLENLEGTRSLEISYYKSDLHTSIDFI